MHMISWVGSTEKHMADQAKVVEQALFVLEARIAVLEEAEE